MHEFKKKGNEIRNQAKQLVYNFMCSNSECSNSAPGMKQAKIFKECGFDWGKYEKATSSQQQFWIVALLRELEAEDQVEQVCSSGPWRLK